MNEEEAVRALRLIKKTFDEHGIVFWLNYGTLLGAIRNQKFIEWDTDIDLSTWHTNIDELKGIANDLHKRGFSTILDNYTLEIDKDGLHIDVYLYHLDLKNMVAVLTTARPPTNYFSRILHYMILRPLITESSSPKKEVKDKAIRSIGLFLSTVKNKLLLFSIVYFVFRMTGGFHYMRIVPSSYFTELSTVVFYDMELAVPNNPEGYLSYIYGDWKKERKDWIGDNKANKKGSSCNKIHDKVYVVCPRCNNNFVVNKPKITNNHLMRSIIVNCDACGHRWKEKVFIVGTINTPTYFSNRRFKR